jgi:light-regulated signal transduction histidine kinase (bacteriophytochrome)
VIRVSAQWRAAEWVFAVKDNGIGVDPEFASRLFVLFHRLHAHADYPGTGIGLAVCKKIVERHGGRIWVESAPGQGASFYFTIPAQGVWSAEGARVGRPLAAEAPTAFTDGAG